MLFKLAQNLCGGELFVGPLHPCENSKSLVVRARSFPYLSKADDSGIIRDIPTVQNVYQIEFDLRISAGIFTINRDLGKMLDVIFQQEIQTYGEQLEIKGLSVFVYLP